MEIKWYGQSCFRVKDNDKIIVFDPFSNDIGLTLPKLIADIILVSHNHHDHNNVVAIISEDNKKPFIVASPGEYEVSGVYIHGISSFHDKKEGEERGQNTIYVVNFNGIKICHLGDLGTPLSNGNLEALGEIDILFVPVGGKYTINIKEVMEVINQIDPKIIIPMHYKIPGLNIDIDGIENFAKQFKISSPEGQDFLKINKVDLPAKEREAIILKAKK